MKSLPLQMNMAWLWYLRGCATLGIDTFLSIKKPANCGLFLAF
jgi:hypothetical protein